MRLKRILDWRALLAGAVFTASVAAGETVWRLDNTTQLVGHALAVEGAPRIAEIEGAKARLLTRFWSGLRQQNGKAEALGQAETTLGDYRRLFEAPAQFEAVDAAAVVRVCETYLRPERLTAVIARPSGDEDQA